MSDGFQLRATGPDDREAIERLGDLSADGGAVAYRVHAQRRGSRAPLTPSVGVVAVDPSDGQIVGSARMTLGRFRYEAQERPYALLGSLMVHPAHRRQGIAAALARWRIDHAEQLAGPQLVVLADIQRGNTGSMAAARRWATAFTAPSLTVPVPMRSRAPRAARGVEIRPASTAELPEAAVRVTEATAQYNFARIWTAELLEEWLRWTPVELPVHHYRVAVDRSGALVAGLALRQEGLLRTMEVVRMPAALRLANTVLRVVPKDGVLRNLIVEHFWFLPGHREAAAALWEDTRWSFRDGASDLLITLDRRDPVTPVLGIRPWTPRTSITTAVRAVPAPTPTRLVASIE